MDLPVADTPRDHTPVMILQQPGFPLTAKQVAGPARLNHRYLLNRMRQQPKRPSPRHGKSRTMPPQRRICSDWLAPPLSKAGSEA